MKTFKDIKKGDQVIGINLNGKLSIEVLDIHASEDGVLDLTLTPKMNCRVGPDETSHKVFGANVERDVFQVFSCDEAYWQWSTDTRQRMIVDRRPGDDVWLLFVKPELRLARAILQGEAKRTDKGFEVLVSTTTATYPILSPLNGRHLSVTALTAHSSSIMDFMVEYRPVASSGDKLADLFMLADPWHYADALRYIRKRILETYCFKQELLTPCDQVDPLRRLLKHFNQLTPQTNE